MTRALWWTPFVACALLFHFKNLGSTSLWQDEAETAVLARNVLRFGLPKVSDGVNVVSQNLGTDHDSSGVWNYSPWLGIYLVAGSFAVFGESNFSARLPFALASLLTLLFLYGTVLRWSRDRRVAALAVWLNLLSVPYLLHARQCRYYVLDALFALYLLYAYESLLAADVRPAGASRHAGPIGSWAPPRLSSGFAGATAGNGWAGFHLAISSLLLFHSNFLVFFAVAGGVLAHFALFARDRAEFLRRHATALGATALTLVPGVLYFHLFARAGGEDPRWLFGRWENFRYYAAQTDLHLFPVLLFPFLALERGRLGNLRGPLAYLGGGLGFLCFAPHHFFRYLIPFIPLCSFIVAELFWRIHDRWRPASWALLVAFAFSHALSLTAWKRGKWRNEWPDLVAELSRPIQEPVTAAARLLREQGRPGELLLVSYPDLPFIFYTPLRVIGGRSGPHAIRPAEVRWVLLRDESEKAAWPLDFKEFEKVRIDAPNWPWGNRPDPDLHLFRTATTPESAFIYRRI